MNTQSPSIPRVLVLLGCFGRGIEASGPNQTLLGMVHATRGAYDFRVVAEAVEGDRPEKWQIVSGVPQMPIPSGVWGAAALRRIISDTPHDILITNGFFDRTMTLPMLVMRRLGLIARKPTMLAPHGDLSRGAMDLKGKRKRTYVQAVRTLGLLKGVTLIATTPEEAKEIASWGDFGARIQLCPNIYPIPPAPSRPQPVADGTLRVVYASRIDEKKNLHFAIELLARFPHPVAFDIFGPISDPKYWQECCLAIAALPNHVRAHHRGVLKQSELRDTLASYDLMLLPSLGENFGYSIADALLAGTPVVISDRTPWRGLERAGAGWDIPLENPDEFVSTLLRFHAMAPQARAAQQRAARDFAIEHLEVEASRAALRTALNSALESKSEQHSP